MVVLIFSLLLFLVLVPTSAHAQILNLYPEAQAESLKRAQESPLIELEDTFCPPAIAGKTFGTKKSSRVTWEACEEWAVNKNIMKDQWLDLSEEAYRSFQLEQLEKVVKAKEREADLLRRLKAANDVLLGLQQEKCR